MVFHDPKSKVVGVLLQLRHKKVTSNHLVDVWTHAWSWWYSPNKKHPPFSGFLISRPKCHPRFPMAFQGTVGIHSGIHGGFFGWIYGESLRRWSLESRVTWAFPRGLFGHCVNLGVFEMCIPKRVILEKNNRYN